MESTYRFRLLIYFAAFMLVMSLCFVYAEPIPHASNRRMFSTAAQPSFDPAALRIAYAPRISPAVLEQLEQATHPRHGLFRHSRRALPLAGPVAPGIESSGLSNRSITPLAPINSLETR